MIFFDMKLAKKISIKVDFFFLFYILNLFFWIRLFLRFSIKDNRKNKIKSRIFSLKNGSKKLLYYHTIQ